MSPPQYAKSISAGYSLKQTFSGRARRKKPRHHISGSVSYPRLSGEAMYLKIGTYFHRGPPLSFWMLTLSISFWWCLRSAELGKWYTLSWEEGSFGAMDILSNRLGMKRQGGKLHVYQTVTYKGSADCCGNPCRHNLSMIFSRAQLMSLLTKLLKLPANLHASWQLERFLLRNRGTYSRDVILTIVKSTSILPVRNLQ